MSLLERLFVGAFMVLTLAGPVGAAELLMYRREGCPWCRAWDEAIGPVYGKTDLSRRLPLRHVDLDRDPAPAVALAHTVRFTPTFVLVEDGREIGRIEGYPGDAFFWGLLDKLAQRLPAGS